MPDSVPTMPRRIVTDRLALTTVQPSDAADQIAAITSSLDELKQWMPWAHREQSLELSELNLAQGMAKFYAHEMFDWTIREQRTGAFLGRVGMFDLDASVPRCELGYWLATARTGQGFMREAVRGVVDAALAAGYRRIQIRCDVRNTRSSAIPEALGFTREGVLRHDSVAADDPTRLRDTAVYALVP